MRKNFALHVLHATPIHHLQHQRLAAQFIHCWCLLQILEFGVLTFVFTSNTYRRTHTPVINTHTHICMQNVARSFFFWYLNLFHTITITLMYTYVDINVFTLHAMRSWLPRMLQHTYILLYVIRSATPFYSQQETSGLNIPMLLCGKFWYAAHIHTYIYRHTHARTHTSICTFARACCITKKVALHYFPTHIFPNAALRYAFIAFIWQPVETTSSNSNKNNNCGISTIAQLWRVLWHGIPSCNKKSFEHRDASHTRKMQQPVGATTCRQRQTHTRSRLFI